MNFRRVLVYSICATFIISFSSIPVVQAGYSKSRIISDSQFLAKDTMNAGDINNFLASKGSGYTNYVIPEYIRVPYPTGAHTWGYMNVRQWNASTGETFFGLSVAQLIYNKAQQHRINPWLILATLQKESSGVTQNILGSPADAWAMGYGYNDATSNCWNSGSNCNSDSIRQAADDFGGVGQQLAYSIWWFKDKYNYFQTHSLTTAIDGETVNCETVGTRVLYYYTPHFSGNQNFYNIYSGWFGDPTNDSFEYNDTDALASRTYNSNVTISGIKRSDTQLYRGGQLITDTGTTRWSLNLDLNIGANDTTLTYITGGNVAGTKTISITRLKVGDINGDGRVNILDLSILSNNYGKGTAADPMANLNPTVDNEVNLLDVSIFANKWEG